MQATSAHFLNSNPLIFLLRIFVSSTSEWRIRKTTHKWSRIFLVVRALNHDTLLRPPVKYWHATPSWPIRCCGGLLTEDGVRCLLLSRLFFLSSNSFKIFAAPLSDSSTNRSGSDKSSPGSSPEQHHQRQPLQLQQPGTSRAAASEFGKKIPAVKCGPAARRPGLGRVNRVALKSVRLQHAADAALEAPPARGILIHAVSSD